MKQFTKTFLFIVIFALVILFTFCGRAKIDYDKLPNLFENERIENTEKIQDNIEEISQIT